MSDHPELIKARRWIQNQLARRDHSDRELEAKMHRRFEPEIVAEAMEWYQHQTWRPNPDEMSANLVRECQRKGKGSRFIAALLRQKGLPSMSFNFSEEWERARQELRVKFQHASSQELRARQVRFLRTRGFDEEVIRGVIYEEW